MCDAQPDLLAHHFSQAQLWEKAVHYARLAFLRNKAASQFAEALQMVGKAVTWLEQMTTNPSRRLLLIELLFEQESYSEILGRREAQQEIIDRLVDVLDPEKEASQLADLKLPSRKLWIVVNY